jgi:hypothetical protein
MTMVRRAAAALGIAHASASPGGGVFLRGMGFCMNRSRDGVVNMLSARLAFPVSGAKARAPNFHNAAGFLRESCG